VSDTVNLQVDWKTGALTGTRVTDKQASVLAGTVAKKTTFEDKVAELMRWTRENLDD
jgi:hypothetical protein